MTLTLSRAPQSPKRSPRSALFLATILSAGLLAGCSSPEQRMEKFTKNGQEYFENGDYLRANLEFRNALNIDETHLPALNGLIDIAEENGEYELMFGLLQRLIRQEPENIEALVKLGNIYLLASDEAEAQATADKALAIDPNYADAKSLRAAVLYKIGDRANALRLADEILLTDPTNRNAITLVVANLANENKYDQALVEVDKGLAADNSNTLLQLLKVELLSKLDRQDDVDQVFSELITNNPEDASFRVTYARNLIRLGRYNEARPVLSDIVELTPDDLGNRMNLIRLDYQLGGADKARATFEQLIALKPDDIELNFAYADFLIQNDDLDKAQEVYQRYAKNKKDETLRNRGKNALAGLYIRTDRRAEAEKLINEVLKVDEGNTEALAARAGLKIQDKDYDSAIIDLRRVLGSDPDDTRALMLIATAFEQKGDIELADKQLVIAFERSGGTPLVANTLAKYLVRNNKVARAEQTLSQSLSKYPDNVEGLRLLAASRLSLQDWQGAEEAAQLIEQRAGSDDLAINRILGTASIGQQDYASAITQLRAANDEQPLSAQPLATLISAYLEEDRNDEARILLVDMVRANPENYDARILLARVYFAENNLDDADSALNEAIRVAPERIEAYDLLYRYYLRSGRRAEAFALIYDGLAKYPNSYGLKVFEADILMNERQFDQAIAVYEGLLERRPDDRLIANNYASLVSDMKTDQASLAKAVEVAQVLRDVDNPDFQDTVGWAYYKNGRADQAVEILERAVAKYPNVAVLRYHLGASLIAIGKTEDGRSQLQQSLELGGARFRHAQKVKDLLQQG